MTLLPSNPHLLVFLFVGISFTGYGPPHILKKNISKLNFDPVVGPNFPFYWAQVGEFCQLHGPYVFWA